MEGNIKMKPPKYHKVIATPQFEENLRSDTYRYNHIHTLKWVINFRKGEDSPWLADACNNTVWTKKGTKEVSRKQSPCI